MASLELGVPITPAHVFPAASISKQFTAMSILLLSQRGQLALDDDVGKYIPEWADHGSRITIRNLLNHTSGLRDAFLLEGLAPPRSDGGNPNEGILKFLVRARGLNFQPGTEFQYNNGAYNLLGGIVKRVSRQSLREFTDANIFKPLGMTHTHFHDDPSMVVQNRVSGYHQDAQGFHVASENGGIVGNAGLQTTVGDLLIWEQNFADLRVGDRALLDARTCSRRCRICLWQCSSLIALLLSVAPNMKLRIPWTGPFRYTIAKRENGQFHCSYPVQVRP